MNIDIKDEILTGEPRYRIRDNNGNIIQDNVSIEQITGVIQEPTPVNKALLENLQTSILNDSSQLVADIVLEEDTRSVEITNIDMVADGGIYDLIVVGEFEYTSAGSASLGIQVNGITDAVYTYKEYSSGTMLSGKYLLLGINMNGNKGMVKATIGIINGTLYVISTSVYQDSVLVDNIYIGSITQTLENVTSLKISNQALLKLKAGSQIKLCKRR